MEPNLSNGTPKRIGVQLSRNALPKRSSVRLSLNARWILAGLSVSLLLLLFPPFWYGNGHQWGMRQWHFFLDSRYTLESVPR